MWTSRPAGERRRMIQTGSAAVEPVIQARLYHVRHGGAVMDMPASPRVRVTPQMSTGRIIEMAKSFMMSLVGLHLMLVACGCSMASQRHVSPLTATEYLQKISPDAVHCHSELCLMAGGLRVESSGHTLVDLVLVGRHPEFEETARSIGFAANASPDHAFRLLQCTGEAGADYLELTDLGPRRLQPRSGYIHSQPGSTVRSHMIVPIEEDRYMALIPVYIYLRDRDLAGEGWAIQLKDDAPGRRMAGTTLSVDTSVTYVDIRSVEIICDERRAFYEPR